jgi:hypothetical protein
MMLVMLVQSLKGLRHTQDGGPLELPITPSSEYHCCLINDVEESLRHATCLCKNERWHNNGTQMEILGTFDASV